MSTGCHTHLPSHDHLPGQGSGQPTAHTRLQCTELNGQWFLLQSLNSDREHGCVNHARRSLLGMGWSGGRECQHCCWAFTGTTGPTQSLPA